MVYSEEKDPLLGMGKRHHTASILSAMGLSKSKIEPPEIIPEVPEIVMPVKTDMKYR